MKKVTNLLLGIALMIGIGTQAQISVQVNLGTPPVWAPADRVETQYYYLPEVDAYYDVPSERFIYISNGAWIRSVKLPYRYRNYNLRQGKVIYLTDYRGNSPYQYHKKHKIKYVTINRPNREFYDRDEHHDKENGHGKSKGKGHKKD